MTDSRLANQLGGIFASNLDSSQNKPSTKSKVDESTEKWIQPMETMNRPGNSELAIAPQNGQISDFDKKEVPILCTKRDQGVFELANPQELGHTNQNILSEGSFSFGPSSQKMPISFDFPPPSNDQNSQVLLATGNNIDTDPYEPYPPLYNPEEADQTLDAENCQKEVRIIPIQYKHPLSDLLAFAACYSIDTPLMAVNNPAETEADYLEAFLADNPPCPTELFASAPEETTNPPLNITQEPSYHWSPGNLMASIVQDKDSPSFAPVRSSWSNRFLPISNQIRVQVRFGRMHREVTCRRNSVVAAVVRDCLPQQCFEPPFNGDFSVKMASAASIIADVSLVARLCDLVSEDCRFVELEVVSKHGNEDSKDVTTILERFLASAGNYSVRPSAKKMLTMLQRDGSLRNFTVANQYASVTVLSPVDVREIDLRRDIRLRHLDVEFPTGWSCLVRIFGVGERAGQRMAQELLRRNDILFAIPGPGCLLFVTDN